MPTLILQAPTHGPPHEALKTSQLAPLVLQTKAYSSSGPNLPWPLSILFPPAETPETWITYENLLLSCLRTGDDDSARKCLERLVTRFTESNERVLALKGLYQEAVAPNDAALEAILEGYDKILEENPTNMPIRKRRIALLQSLSRTPEAIAGLTDLVSHSPTDAEAWAELSALYASQNMLPQAIFALEEVLLFAPNAWNVHARLGELQYLSALAGAGDAAGNLRGLAEALRRYARAVELCDDYLRGYYGLKLTAKRLLGAWPKSSKQVVQAEQGDLEMPSLEKVERLHELATRKLAEIVRKGSAKEPGWEGYDAAELIAARELLDGDTQKIER